MTNPDRVRNRDALCVILEERLATADTEHWQAELLAAGVPVAPVADVADILASPQTEALGMMQPLEHPSIDGLLVPALPLSFDGERSLHRTAPPQVGADTDTILGDLGFTDDELAALAAEGVIKR